MPRTILDLSFQVEHLSILDSDGNLDTALEPDIPPVTLQAMYRAMLVGRRLDERMVRLQRQGRIGTFAPDQGAGGHPRSAASSRSGRQRLDGAVLSRDGRHDPPRLAHRANPGLLRRVPRGRPARVPSSGTFPSPSRWPPSSRTRWASPTRPSTAGDDAVVMVYFGDGATSEGDFHEAANFAGVWGLAGRLRLPEQPVGDLRAAQEADPLAHHRPEGARLRLPWPAGGRQRRRSPCTRPAARRSSARGPGTAPRSSSA